MTPERIAELRLKLGMSSAAVIDVDRRELGDLLATDECYLVLRELADAAEQVIDDLDTRFEHAELRHCIRAALSTKGTE